MSEFRELKKAWRELDTQAQLQNIEGCRLACVAAGRIRLLRLKTRRISGRLLGMISTGEITGQRAEAEAFINRSDEINNRANSWSALESTAERMLPETASDLVPFLTKKELRDLLAPIHESARQAGKPCRATRAMPIRRVPCLFSPRCHYDHTDALFWAMRSWGGQECLFLGGLAAAEIGRLRDPKFVFPAATAAEADDRLMAVACLAFVQSMEGSELLKMIAMNDPYRACANRLYGLIDFLVACGHKNWPR